MENQNMVCRGMGFSQLSKCAWSSLKGKWLVTIGCLLLAMIIQAGASYIPVAGKFSQLLLCPLAAGMLLFDLHLIRGLELNAGLLFKPFEQYLRFLWANIRVIIFIFLWFLLLIVPGIIASLRYSMTIFIMLDDPTVSPKDAMKQSSEIMYGHKWQMFGYSCLLMLICFPILLLTLGLGAFVLVPWLGAWGAAFYESIRRHPESSTEDNEVATGTVV